MKIKKYIKALTIILVVSMFMSISYASKIVSTEGNIETAGADITVSVDADTSDVYPGKIIKYEPKIDYKGVDSYIRMKLEFDNKNITEDMFSKLDDKWVKQGEYYYYKEPVKHKECIESFKTISIPKEWNENTLTEFTDSKFKITILCDAIQAEHFTPKFDEAKPWGDVCVSESSYDGTNFVVNSHEEEKIVSIHFHGAGQFGISSKDLLSNDILPGDTIRGKVNFTNRGKHNLKVTFFVSKEDINLIEGEETLLDKCKLKLFSDGNKIYDGNLRGEVLYVKRTLFSLKPSETKNLEYEIYMPIEIDNKYSNKSDSFVWNFSSENAEESIIETPVTGDKVRLIFYLALSIVSFALLVILKKWRKSDGIESN